MTMTDMEPDTPGPLLKHMRAQNDALRWEIVREIAHMNHGDLQAVLRMIEQWKAGK
jgi:phosphoribosyl 1,2-cyclic phosphodiesterase